MVLITGTPLLVPQHKHCNGDWLLHSPFRHPDLQQCTASACGTCSHSMAAKAEKLRSSQDWHCMRPHPARRSCESSSCSLAGHGQVTVPSSSIFDVTMRKEKLTSTPRVIHSTWQLTHHISHPFSQLPYLKFRLNQADTQSPLNGFTKTPQKNCSSSPSFLHSLQDVYPQHLEGQFSNSVLLVGLSALLAWILGLDTISDHHGDRTGHGSLVSVFWALVYVYKHTHRYIYIYIYMYILYICTYICTCTHFHLHIYRYRYRYTHTHTHAHTHARPYADI